MAVASARSTTITFTGDVTYQQQFSAASNAVAPGEVEKKDLANGNNTITVPTAGGATAKAVTIIPPSANVQTMVLKGVAGDTGVSLHLTDPTTISLNSVVSFVITTNGAITGALFVWS